MKRKELRSEALAVSEQFAKRVTKLRDQETVLTKRLQELVSQRASSRITERLAGASSSRLRA